MVLEPILGTEQDHNPFKSTHDSDSSSHTNDWDKHPLQELLYVRKLLNKFYLKQRGNIVLLKIFDTQIRGCNMQLGKLHGNPWTPQDIYNTNEDVPVAK